MIVSPQKNSQAPSRRVLHPWNSWGQESPVVPKRGWWENRGENDGTIWKNLEKTHQKVGWKPWKIMFKYVLIDLELGEIYMD